MHRANPTSFLRRAAPRLLAASVLLLSVTTLQAAPVSGMGTSSRAVT